ncbi:Bacterial type II secretion system protein F domain protein (plasmid) [Variovorax sp. SRS16]|uniref:hypothetical protein n=1 Tax=Variovorax sp. SRS16 TaxID=282217 RepID=UPI001318E44D|nr:hypothetical protein [Variovorax sp. SRS16]VTU46179.1 Bacterial type II secretion system protein F domain protein [Variovorax sp. SRS16]
MDMNLNMAMNLNRLVFKFHCFLWSFNRSHFYRDLSDNITRRVGIGAFLERAASNARIFKDSTAVRVYQAMSMRLAAGQSATLSEIVLGIAPPSDQLLMRSVDDAGASQAQALLLCADAVEFQQRSLRVIGFELIVPLVAIPIVAAITYITSGIVTGIAAGGSDPEVWNGFNGFARWLAETVTTYAVGISIAAVAAIAGTIYALPRWTGNLRLRVENWPVLSLYRDYNAAVVLSAVAMMIRSGRTMVEALEALRSPSQPWLRWHIARILRSIEDNPTDYIAAFGRGLMPPAVRARLASLTDSNRSFDEALIVLGTSEIASLEKRVKLSAEAMKWALLSVFVSVAVVLSIGTMSIASSLASSSDPTTRLLHRVQQN